VTFASRREGDLQVSERNILATTPTCTLPQSSQPATIAPGEACEHNFGDFESELFLPDSVNFLMADNDNAATSQRRKQTAGVSFSESSNFKSDLSK
jgi:hypothetical protein